MMKNRNNEIAWKTVKENAYDIKVENGGQVGQVDRHLLFIINNNPPHPYYPFYLIYYPHYKCPS